MVGLAASLFHVAIRDEPGALARLTSYLADWRVNLVGFVADESGLRLITSDAVAARRAFEDAGLLTIEVPVLEVVLPDVPGALAVLCRQLADARIAILAAFGVGDGTTARICLHASDAARAAPILRAFSASGPLPSPEEKPFWLET